MIRTRGGHRYRPRVRFITPERDGAGTSRAADAHFSDQVVETPPTLAPADISEEAHASEPPSRRYQTKAGPRAPFLVHPRPRRRAPPSKRSRTSSPSESSRSRPEPSPSPADQGSPPQLSPTSRIRRPMFSCDPILGNVDLRARDFNMESYYDILVLTADQRFRDSMRLIGQYSLLPFMTPRQFFYPRVVLEFYHTMTSRGVPSPLEIRFSIDCRLGVLRATDITTVLVIPIALVNSTGYRQWLQPSQGEMVRCLARDTTAGPILFCTQLAPQMLLVDHALRNNLFPLQHFVQRRGAILEALYRISEGFWFSPSGTTYSHYNTLLHFEEKVHRKGLARAEAFPLLMLRLLSQVLEHLGFPEESRIDRRISCTQVLSTEQSLYMSISIILQQEEEVADDVAEDPPRGEHFVPEVEVEVERTPIPNSSTLAPPPTAPAPTDTDGPSYTSQQSSEHIHVSSRDLAAVMDVVCALATTQASLDQRMARVEVTRAKNHSMLLQIMSHLDLPLVSLTKPAQPTRDQSTVAASLDMLATAAAASDPPTSTPP